MDYKEAFEVVTAPDGSSELTITLACATVREHYDRTTTAHSSVATDPAEKCSTGLRVYEGAQVLAAFLYRYWAALLFPASSTLLPGQEPATTSSPTTSSVAAVELGCGCGLVGFTLDAALRATADVTAATHATQSLPITSPSSRVSVVFTDASDDCLALVRRSGRLAGRIVRDLDHPSAACTSNRVNTSSHSPAKVDLSTFHLAWSEEGTRALQEHLPSCSGIGGAQLVVGSDLMYYRVDVDALVHTAKSLLPNPNSPSAPLASASQGLVVFAHFMRIPDGQRKLATIARERQHLSIVAVPLTAFLDKEAIHCRGWNGIEVVILAPTASTGGEERERENEDVHFMKNLLVARAVQWETNVPVLSPYFLSADASRRTAAARQARALADALQPYPSSVLVANGCNVVSIGGGGGGDAASATAVAGEEDAFLHLFL